MTIPISFILLLVSVESNHNAFAKGKHGEIGFLQMTSAYVQDASEYANEDWVHQDCISEFTAIQIFRAYMARYATEKRLGRPVTYEDIARIHNGGPNGYKKESTIPYWNKIKCLLKQQSM